MSAYWFWRALGWSAGLVLVQMIVTWFAPGWAGSVFNVVAFSCFAELARFSRLGSRDVGVERSAAEASIRRGILLSLGAMGLVVTTALVWPNEFEPAPAHLPALIIQLLRVLLITALIEEFLFRGVLHAAWRRAFPLSGHHLRHTVNRVAAWIGTGVWFGLWHVGPTRDTLVALGKSPSLDAIAGPVLFTMLMGTFLFAPMREWTGSIVAPVLVHFAVNATAIVAAFVLA